MKNISWKFLTIYGNNKYVNRTYIYLFAIPLIISIIKKLEFLNLSHAIPFSWQLLFLSAIFFSLGTLIFNWFAPSIIKDNNTFADFINNGKTWWNLQKYKEELNLPFDEYNSNYLIFRENNPIDYASKEYIDKFLLTLPQEKIEYFKFIRKYYDDQEDKKATWPHKFETGSEEVKFERIKLNTQLNQQIDSENLKISFWNIYEYSKLIKPIARIFCLLFFALGTLCFTLVIINSVFLVFQIEGFELLKWK